MPISLPYVLLDSPAAVSSRLDLAECVDALQELADARKAELAALTRELAKAQAHLQAANDELDALRNKAQAIMGESDPLTRGLLANALVASLLRPYGSEKTCPTCDASPHAVDCPEPAIAAEEMGGDL